MKVAVLGCGPAGLLAAHACRLHKVPFDIVSQHKKSNIGGAQFLHVSIPGLTSDDPDGMVEFVHNGSERGYAKKVYGDPYAVTSWSAYPNGTVPVWNLREIYDQLFADMAKRIDDRPLGPEDVTWLLREYNLVFSCVPAPIWCNHEHHRFESQAVWITPGPVDCRDMQIVYNGDDDVAWYRESSIFGTLGREFASEQGVGAIKIKKPLWTNCPGVVDPAWVPLGRYGLWHKGELTHHAFLKADMVLRMSE